MLGLIWIQTVGHSNGISERIFFQILKKKSSHKKNNENYPVGKDRVGSQMVFAWIHCTDVRIHCTDILIECR